MSHQPAPEHEHYGVLDGWRGISILFVLWGHWLPAGPRGSGMNESFALTGMALFFTLSGFLITTFLYQRPNVREFLIRRLFRIVPLAWLFSAVALIVIGADAHVWAAHLLFYGNLPPWPLLHVTSHLWSLCVEMHFYVGVAILVGLLGRRALYALPLLCLAVTGLRIAHGEIESIVTWYRLDEILTGATLALVRLRWAGKFFSLPYLLPLLLLLAVLLIASGNPHSGPLNYLRGYLASTLVGLTIFCAEGRLLRVLQGRVLAYIAKISYALYVLHGGLTYTWLGTGEGLQKYLKRPLLAAVTFALAHLSTFTFEARAQALGRSIARRWAARVPA